MRIPLVVCVYYLTLVVATIVGGFRYRNLSRSLRILEWLFVFNVVEVTIQIALAVSHIHNLWTGHFYTFFEFIFIVLIFLNWMKPLLYRWMLWFCCSAFALFWIISKFTFEPISAFGGWTATISRILQIIFSIIILVTIVKENDIVWTKDPRFWVAASIIFYAAGSIFMFALFNNMLDISPQRLKSLWPMNSILMIISNLLYIRAFLCKT